MSEENVEAVRALFAAFAQRDFEAVADFLDPAVEVRPAIVGGPEGRSEEFRNLDGDVLVLGRAVARGRASGITLDAEAAWIAAEAAWIARVHDRKLVDFRSFTSQQEALDAAGSRE